LPVRRSGFAELNRPFQLCIFLPFKLKAREGRIGKEEFAKRAEEARRLAGFSWSASYSARLEKTILRKLS
jgi:hypothetical protein